MTTAIAKNESLPINCFVGKLLLETGKMCKIEILEGDSRKVKNYPRLMIKEMEHLRDNFYTFYIHDWTFPMVELYKSLNLDEDESPLDTEGICDLMKSIVELKKEKSKVVKMRISIRKESSRIKFDLNKLKSQLYNKISFLGSYLKDGNGVTVDTSNMIISLKNYRVRKLKSVEQLENEFGLGIYQQSLLSPNKLKKKYGNDVSYTHLVPCFSIKNKETSYEIVLPYHQES